MASRKKSWRPSPSKQSKPKIPPTIKADVERRGNEWVEAVIKLKHIKQPPEDTDFNYFYFYATYHCPSPHALSPSFDTGFARLEYVGGELFNLSYMRHTGQWWELDDGLSLEDCLAAIEDEPHFMP